MEDNYIIAPVVNGQVYEPVVKVGDTQPIGTIVDYDGETVPNGWEQVSDPNEYSTTEQVIGKWIDGKPLYRCVFNISNITDTNSNLVDLQSFNISIMTKITGFIKDTSAFIMPIPLTDSATNYNVLFYNGRYLRGRCSIGTSNPVAQAFAIIEYTKTTD